LLRVGVRSPADTAWVGRQVAWLGRHPGAEGRSGERLKIWPIVQLSDAARDIERTRDVPLHLARQRMRRWERRGSA